MLRRSGAVLAALLLCLLPGWSGAAGAAPSTTISLQVDNRVAAVNGERISLDSAPVIPAGEDRTYVPVRFIGESLGAYIGWDDSERKVTYLTGDQQIELWIGRREARVGGRTVTLDAAPFIDENGRTLVPVRFVSEQLGASVSWDEATQSVTVTAPWYGRVILIKDNAFAPASLEVPAGTRITWVNQDYVMHNVVGAGVGWNSELLSHGQAYTHTFDSSGKVSYSCTMHPNMEAVLTVK